jgi:sugar O-acyltransferase (sialic acid O-acetyltransferase NeuD family)
MKLAVIGAGGHSKVVAEVARSAGYEVICFVANDKTEHFGLEVISFEDFLKSPIKTAAIGIGNNVARKNVYEELKQNGIECPVLIHTSATISPTATIGEASVVMPHSVVNADANIGTACIINTAAVIEHDCTIGDFTHISPNAALAGGVTVGEMSHIGIGANVIQLIKIGKGCIIGAGAAVISDIPDSATAVGVPARFLK